MQHLVGLLAAAGAVALLAAWQLWAPEDEGHVLLSEDERLTRLSARCTAEARESEGNPIRIPFGRHLNIP